MLCVALAAILVVVAGVVAAMYFGTQWLGLQAAVVWAVVVVLSLLAVNATRQWKRQQEQALAEKKRELYCQLVEALRGCFFARDPALAARKEKQRLQKWSLQLALIGSDEVVRAWQNFYDHALGFAENEEDEEEQSGDEFDSGEDPMLDAQARLLQALRRDCGNPRTRLLRWDIADLLANGRDG